MRRISNSGSQYYNYKQFFSIVLFAVTDARYNFRYVHTGVQGKISDGVVLRHTSFRKALLSQNLNVPPPDSLPGRDVLTPNIFLADDAFPLTENICKPYTVDLNVGSPKRVCNYKISRARRIEENSFGTLVSIFLILHATIDVDVKYVKHIVMHIYITFCDEIQKHKLCIHHLDVLIVKILMLEPGSWRVDEPGLTDLRILGRNASTRAKAMRDEFMHYFMTEQGRVAWQHKYLTQRT